MSDEKRKQVAEQCRVVTHLATALARLHADYEQYVARSAADQILDQIGNRTAAWMESLGDMLNAIDAVDEEDEWTSPVFAEAQRLYPQRPPSVDASDEDVAAALVATYRNVSTSLRVKLFRAALLSRGLELRKVGT